MAVIRTLFSLALSTCICGQSLVLRINLRLPWVLITAHKQPETNKKNIYYQTNAATSSFRYHWWLYTRSAFIRNDITPEIRWKCQASVLPCKDSPLCSMSNIALMIPTILFNWLQNLNIAFMQPILLIHIWLKSVKPVKQKGFMTFFPKLSPRRDCSVPSSVDAMSLSLSKPRPLSIHDWAVFSKTYNLHCIYRKCIEEQMLLQCLLTLFKWL